MKKKALALLILVGTLTAQAERLRVLAEASEQVRADEQSSEMGYTHLAFETTDGAKASVSIEGLTLSISGTTLTAGAQSFTLSNLSKMYFSNTNETTTGIEEMTSAALNEVTDIYDLQGHKLTKDQMRKGVYIVKTKSRTFKMLVK